MTKLLNIVCLLQQYVFYETICHLVMGQLLGILYLLQQLSCFHFLRLFDITCHLMMVQNRLASFALWEKTCFMVDALGR